MSIRRRPLRYMPPTREQQALAELNPLDRLSRERWSVMMGAILASFSTETIHAMARRGEREFIRVARPILSGHVFKFDDYKRMYRIVCATSEHIRRTGRKLDPRQILGVSLGN